MPGVGDLLIPRRVGEVRQTSGAGPVGNLQDESRRRSPFVWDCVFKAVQPKYNVQMNFAVDELVAEAKHAGHALPQPAPVALREEMVAERESPASGSDSPEKEQK